MKKRSFLRSAAQGALLLGFVLGGVVLAGTIIGPEPELVAARACAANGWELDTYAPEKVMCVDESGRHVPIPYRK